MPKQYRTANGKELVCPICQNDTFTLAEYLKPVFLKDRRVSQSEEISLKFFHPFIACAGCGYEFYLSKKITEIT